MLDVFFTVDVEVWCGGWQNLDQNFPAAYRRYIHGPTPSGEFGIPFQLKLLNEHKLKGVFFTEPLFSARFGKAPLQDLVGLIEGAGQETQLHLHTEWVDEARAPLLPGVSVKRQHMRHFSRVEQAELIRLGRAMLREAGAPDINAFRAGNFGFNRDTLLALADNAMAFDSSYNASIMGLDSGVMPGTTLTEPMLCDGVHEYPMTVFNDGMQALRHAQLTACSWGELEGLLWQALEQGRKQFVILSHGVELLNVAKDRPDPVVVKRMRDMCAFLDQHRDSFRTCGFRALAPVSVASQPPPLVSPFYRTGLRMMQQAGRRLYG